MTANIPIDELSHEHKYILKVVHGLGVIEERLSQGYVIDLAMMHKVVDFFREFADKCHHAKEEDILFPAMEGKGVPKTGCPLEALRSEHKRGRKMVATLETAIDSFSSDKSESVKELRAAIAAIRKLYPNHIWKEDEMVFPMIQHLFTTEELNMIKNGFDEAEMRLDQFREKHVALANEMESLLSEEIL